VTKLFVVKAWFRPCRNPSLPSPTGPEDADHPGGIIGCGWNRQYIHSDDFHINETNVEFPSSSNLRISQFPPRPIPGSIVDLEVVSQYCDIATGQYLSNCLEYLRIGAALNTLAPRSRRQPSKDTYNGPPPRPPYLITSKALPKSSVLLPYDWRYLYLEERTSQRAPCTSWRRYLGGRGQERRLELASPQAPTGGVPAFTIGGGTEMAAQMEHWGPEGAKPTPWTPGQCESDYPRIFHTYLDKPPSDRLYMALISFFYTQNLGLHLDKNHKTQLPCAPEFWIWVDHSVVQQDKLEKWVAQIMWTSPFIDARFAKFIKFKIWDGTEQMDATVEWSKEWRNRGLYSYSTEKTSTEASTHPHVHEKREADETPETEGFSTAEELHTALNVSMRNTASWLLPHRYGGMFVSHDILFLRDFEEIWNYRGAFGTFSPNATISMPVLKLNKGSAIGTVMLRMGLRHGLKLDKESVRKYARELEFEEMMTPFPDLLADLAFSSSEEYQKARLPAPSLPS
jgi:WD repeat and SOF domain-containing protein 1